MSKRMMTAITITLLLISLSSIGFTVAFLTDQRETVNTFKYGDVKVTLTQLIPEDQTLVPGSVVTRKPVVTNKGVDCYVRAIITVSDMDNNQPVTAFLHFDDLGDGWYSPNPAVDGVWNESNEVVVYYREYLSSEESTNEIFESFQMLVRNKEQQALLEGANEGFQVKITIEAVQASVNGTYFQSPVAAFEGVEVQAADRP